MVTVIRVTPSEAAKLKAESQPSSSAAAADKITSTENASILHAPLNSRNEKQGGNNKRHLPSEDLISGRETVMKRQRLDAFSFDLKSGTISSGNAASGKIMKKRQRTGTSPNNNNDEENDGGKTRALPLESGDSISIREIVMKRIKFHLSASNIDLSDVPPQLPIPKSGGHIKEGASKYTGVSKTRNNKWKAEIMIEGEQSYIGCYENEQEAAADYARAKFKYKGQKALDKARERKSSGISIDLSDNRQQQTPHQPILRSPKHLLL